MLGGHDSLESLMDQVAEEGVAADLTRAIENIGDLKAMGLDFGWGPTAIVEWLLEHIYIDAGLGWGAAIIAVACVVRVTLFPAQLWGSNNAARMACIGPLTAKSQEYLTEALRSGGTDAITAARAQLRNIYKQFNVSPFKSVAPMAGQAIIGFGAFRCLRGMTSLPVPGLAESGFLWFQDLTISDPYYTLPAAIGVSMYYVVKVRECSFRPLDLQTPLMLTLIRRGEVKRVPPTRRYHLPRRGL